ncbi:hypothetical protein Cni_G13752 [Canna indica]|uniref:Transposase MuDR plant domain-containing protein n=1 Tax=Canna indica TaxID=4628 RepID=A0AAQ3KBS2_9LILI|nr:hypothetical protein Cni_G13752 [Canna indica]
MQAVQDYALKNGKAIKFTRSGEKNVEARCSAKCPWRIYGSLTQMNEAFVIKIYDSEHKCSRPARNKQASSKWLARHYMETFRKKPDWNVLEMKRDIDKKFAISVTKNVCYRARARALKALSGLLADHYKMLSSYVVELKKDLQNAVRAFMPNAECARHLYANWKKKHVGYALKNLFWKAAKSITEAQFNEHMYEMKVLSQVVHDDFIKIGLDKFCRFKISTLPKCEVIDNNMSECFNGYILRARNRLLIDMLEDIRRTIMKRMAEKREMIMKSDDTICPKIREKVEENKVVSGFCIATHAGYKKFEVKHMDNNYVAELQQNS